MKDTENVDVAIRLDQVGDPVATVKKYPDISIVAVSMANLRKGCEYGGTLVDTDDGSMRRVSIVCRDVLVNLPQPTLCFSGPSYFRPDSMACSTSS